jgi:Xaa-Pro dipeptidase
MSVSKRDFLKTSGAIALGAAASLPSIVIAKEASLKKITGDAKPICQEERQARIAKAQKLMEEQGIDAIVIEPSSAMRYFTGIRWWPTERLTCVVIPRSGDFSVITPYFEEPSVRESMSFGDDVRTWHEHENPYELVIGVLRDRGFKRGKIGVESSVRYFVVDGLQKASNVHEIVSAEPVILGCRLYKSPQEITLMHKANEVTLTAYHHVWNILEAGMTASDIKEKMHETQTALGGRGAWEMVLLNESSALPHGSRKPQTLREGSVVLMDCGCKVNDYQSDISRSFVFGEATKRQKQVWNTVRRGQQVAFDKAQLGTEAGAVDDAVRQYYESQGYGPGYKLPGLSHRTGHGIGMDGHEKINLVHGEKAQLKPGMCFSNEPGIYIEGEFGIRIEDCIHMTSTGPKWFSLPPNSIDDPIGRMEAL